MKLRRALLFASAALWLGMMGALAYREYGRRGSTRGGDAYVESLFGKDAPVLVSKSVWLRDPTGLEKRIGFLEVQLFRIGRSDVHVRHTLEIYAKDLPPFAMAMVRQMLPELELRDLQGQLDSYVNRRMGLLRVTGRAKYGEDKVEIWGKPVGDYLRITTRIGRQQSSNLVPYDRSLPFGSGGSPFRDAKNLKEGLSWTVTHFDPFTRSSMATLIQVTGRERIKHRGKAVECFVLSAHPSSTGSPGPLAGAYGMPTARAWVSVEGGELLREEAQWMMFKLVLVLEASQKGDYLEKDEPPLPEKSPQRKAGGSAVD